MKPQRIKWFILLSTFLIGIALLIWPINVAPIRDAKWNLERKLEDIPEGELKDYVNSYKKLGENDCLAQDIVFEGETLEELGIWFNSIAPGQNGYVQIALKEASGETVFERTIPLADLKNREITRVHIGQKIKVGYYFVEVRGIDCGKDTFEVGTVVKDDSNEMAVYFQYRKSFNAIQTIMCWFLLFELWLVFYKLFCGFTADKARALLKKGGSLAQFAVILGAITLFFSAAMFSPAVRNEKSLRTVWPWLIIGVVFLAVFKRLRHQTNWKSLKSVIVGKEQLPFVLLSLVCLGTRIPMLGSMQRWDAGEYYYALGTACQNFDFSLKSIIDNFRLCEHSVLGFSLVAAIGEFFSPRNSVGVLIISLILTLLALTCVYCLFKDAWLGCGAWLAAGFTLLVFSTPIFWGTFAYINPDYFLVYYFIILLFTDYKKWYILSFAMAVLISQCKETGVIVLAFYYGFKIVRDFIQSKGGLVKRIVAVLNRPSIWIAVGAGALYELLILRLGSITTWKQNADAENSFLWSNSGAECFGFNPEYILSRLEQFFISNFAWIISLLILCAFVAAGVRRIKRGDKPNSGSVAVKYVGFFGAMSGFALFSMFYITSRLNRYNVMFTVGLSIMGIIAYYYLIGEKRNRMLNIAFVAILTVVFSIQSFWNIDIVSSHVFEAVPISKKNAMLFTALASSTPYYGDGLVNNYQYTWIDQGWNKFLRQIEYDTDETILLPREELTGTHIDGNNSAYSVMWDTQKQKRVIRSGKAGEIAINTFGEPSIIGNVPMRYFEEQYTLDQFPANVYIPIIEYYGVDEDRVLTSIDPYYYLGESGHVSSYGGTIRYYHAIRRDNYNGFNVLDSLNWDEDKAKIDIEDVDTGFVYKTYREIEIDEELLAEKLYQASVKKVKDMTEDRRVIQEGDVVIADLYAQDMEGNDLGTAYVGNANSQEHTFEIGSGRYLSGIEETLIGAELGETLTVECEIPEGYAPALKYQGEKLRFTIIPKEISGVVVMETDPEIQIGVDEKVELRKALKNEQLEKLIVDLSYNIDFDSLNCSEKWLNSMIRKVEAYYKQYLIDHDITKQQLLTDYLQIDEESYDCAMEKIAKLNVCRRAVQKRFSDILEGNSSSNG